MEDFCDIIIVDNKLTKGKDKMGEEMQEKQGLPGRVTGMKNVSITVAVVAMIVAAVGLAVGIYGIMQFQDLTKKMDVSDKKTPTVTATVDCETSSDGGEEKCIKPAEDAEKDLLIAESDYVYIGEWGIKIHVPESAFEKLAYQYVEDGTAETVYFNGVVSGASVSEPAYYSTDKSLVAISRVKGEGAGTKVYSNGEYNFYIQNAQTVNSTDASEQEVEKDSMDKLKEVLSDSSNYSKF